MFVKTHLFYKTTSFLIRDRPVSILTAPKLRGLISICTYNWPTCSDSKAKQLGLLAPLRWKHGAAVASKSEQHSALSLAALGSLHVYISVGRTFGVGSSLSFSLSRQTCSRLKRQLTNSQSTDNIQKACSIEAFQLLFLKEENLIWMRCSKLHKPLP